MLNLKLQGHHQIIPTLIKKISVFEEKLDLFISQLQNSNFTHFPAHSKVAQENLDLIKSEWFDASLQKFKSDFSACFQNIRPLTPLVLFVDNPFTSDVSVSIMAANMHILGGDEGALQLEIIEMQHNMALEDKRKDTMPKEF